MSSEDVEKQFRNRLLIEKLEEEEMFKKGLDLFSKLRNREPVDSEITILKVLYLCGRASWAKEETAEEIAEKYNMTQDKINEEARKELVLLEKLDFDMSKVSSIKDIKEYHLKAWKEQRLLAEGNFWEAALLLDYDLQEIQKDMRMGNFLFEITAAVDNNSKKEDKEKLDSFLNFIVEWVYHKNKNKENNCAVK